jgi:hypothetical protein
MWPSFRASYIDDSSLGRLGHLADENAQGLKPLISSVVRFGPTEDVPLLRGLTRGFVLSHVSESKHGAPGQDLKADASVKFRGMGHPQGLKPRTHFAGFIGTTEQLGERVIPRSRKAAGAEARR